jgi:uncharacterized protein with GYD domain
MWGVSYGAEGVRGLIKDGGTTRRKMIEDLLKAAGGKLEAFYFAFGKYDAYVIADLPNNADAAGMGLAVNASGAVTVTTTVLLTPEEIDEASAKNFTYSAPGQ